MQYFKTTSLRWWLLVIVANVLLTSWMVYAVPTLDYDAILYISAAKAIANNDWQLSSDLYRGSLYPYLIYLSQKLSGLSYEVSAHFLNALFFSITSYAFISIVKKIGGNSRAILFISLTVILFFPGILKYRPDIFREFGFFACYFWSIYCLLEFYDTKQKKYLFIWFSLLSVGLFFRVESVVFLIGISAIFVLQAAYKNLQRVNKSQRIKYVFFFLFSFVIIFVILKLLGSDRAVQSAFSYPIEYINKALSLLKQKLIGNSDGLLGVLKNIFQPIGNVLYIIFQRFEVIYALLIIVAYKAKLVLVEPLPKKVILSYLSISFIILVLFQMSLAYIASRYALTFVLTALLLVPFVLEKAIQLMLQGRLFQKVGITILLLVLCFLSVKRLGVSDRDIEINTGLWITNNISEKSVVISNNSKVLYYAKRFPYLSFREKGTYPRFSTQLMLSPRNREEFETADYIAFMVKPGNQLDLNNEELFVRMHGEPVKRIEQRNSDVYVSIYKVK